MNMNEIVLAAPNAATDGGSAGLAGSAVAALVVMLLLLGTSPRRAAKLESSAKAKAKGKKPRKPIGPFNPDNWEDGDPPAWLGPATVVAGVVVMGLFMEVRQKSADAFWAKPAELLMTLTQKIAEIPMIKEIGNVYLALLVLGGLMISGMPFRTKFFLGMAVSGLVFIANGTITDILQMLVGTVDSTMDGVAVQ